LTDFFDQNMLRRGRACDAKLRRKGNVFMRYFRWLGVFIGLFLLAGCDKCGHPVKFNVPSIPDACNQEPPAEK
jgi:hypothetical protein